MTLVIYIYILNAHFLVFNRNEELTIDNYPSNNLEKWI